MSEISPAYRAEIERWRHRRLAKLTAPDGWLSLVGLYWLEEGDHQIGSDSSAWLRVPEIGGAKELGSIEVSARGAVLREGPRAIPLVADPSSERPFLRHGSLSLSLIARGQRLAVRVRDSESEARIRFRGIASFSIDPAWRLEADFLTHSPPCRIPVPNVLGAIDDEVSPGAVVFEAGGAVHRLDAIVESGETDYWIIFGDATNGRETYGGGRFVYVSPPVGGRTVIDFNKAYNPPCVFTPYTTCPLPPPQNRLTIRVEAGEKRF